MNNCVFTGRFAKDPVVVKKDNGIVICNFGLVVDRKSSAKKADYIPFVAFGKDAENIGKYMKKGRPIEIVGELNTSSYDKKDGSGKGYSFQIKVSSYNFVNSGKPKEDEADGNEQSFDSGFEADMYEVDGDIPFDDC